MMSVKKLQDKMYIGENVVLVGLCLQILFFGIFVMTSIVVHIRMARQQHKMEDCKINWKRMLIVLYVVSSLICLRNIYRAVEYELGSDGYLLANEWPGFVFDGALMVLVLGVCVRWDIGSGSKLSPGYDGYANTTELKVVGSRSPSPLV